MGSEVLKSGAKKLRRLYNSKILSGFAGSTATAFALFARFEAKLEQYSGNLPRTVVELAKDWRTDRMLRHLEALLLVADTAHMYIVTISPMAERSTGTWRAQWCSQAWTSCDGQHHIHSAR